MMSMVFASLPYLGSQAYADARGRFSKCMIRAKLQASAQLMSPGWRSGLSCLVGC